MRSYLRCNLLKSEEGSLTSRSLFHEVGDNEHLWLLKMACFLLHTSHILSNIYNSANFPDRSKHSQTIGKTTSAHFSQSYMVENGDGVGTIIGVDVDIENLHACIYIFLKKNMYPLGLHVLGVTSTLFNALHEWRKSTVARWLK